MRPYVADRLHAPRPLEQARAVPAPWTPTARYDEIFTGWAYPPTDYVKWADLVHAVGGARVENYGRAEVEQWYWEVWNEPNIGYWQGTPEEFQQAARLRD